MLRVLLVDDEPNVRNGIRIMIPWDELGLAVIAEAGDGDEGLSKILSLKPDIVIADVKMPGMTGIQMIEAACKNGFKGKCLILSGYSDFTYAKEAMQLGVKQFILKPLDEDELIKALKDVHYQILNERQSSYYADKGNEYINEKLVKALLLGDRQAFGSMDISSYSYRNYDVALISAAAECSEEEQSALLESVYNEIQGNNDVDVITTDLSGMLAVLFKGWKRSRIIDFLMKLNKIHMRKVFITLGLTATGIYMIKQSYYSADSLYKNRFLYLHYGVVTSENASKSSTGDLNELDEAARQIYAYIEINDIPKLEASLEQLQDTLCKNGLTPERIKVICITLVMDFKSRLIKNFGDKKSETAFEEDTARIISSMNSLFEIIEMLKETLSGISNTYFGKTTKSTMERVVQYIKANYTRELKLEMLAGIFGYNSAYLGKVFHQYTGDNFNNYLDGIRITEAKRLLSMEEHKVYEVAEMVGYSNINYFHNKFKKLVGISPLSYKKKYAGYQGDNG